MSIQPACLIVIVSLVLLPAGPVSAEVKQRAADGFLLEFEREVEVAPGEAYDRMVRDFGSWWNPEHSYGGVAENLSLHLEQRCLLETLPEGGFVRHLEIVAHMPGQMMVLRGGLGPLQPMGVNGALVIQFRPGDNGRSLISVRYAVHGPTYQNLQELAAPVDGVLAEQLDRLQKLLNTEAG